MNGLSDAVLILVGGELLDGRTVDRNLSAVAGILADYGLGITECRVVPDDVGAIGEAVRTLASPGRLVLTTGGLGPTDDDMTMEGVAAALSTTIGRNPEAEEMIRQGYLSRSMEMPASALVQADIPMGAVPVENPAGVAPGVVTRVPGALVVSLPGVPAEAGALLPACLDTAGIRRRPSNAAVLVRTWGIYENRLYDILSPIASAHGVDLAFLPSPGRVDVRISGGPAVEFAGKAAEVLGEHVYGNDPEAGLEAVVGRRLLDLGWTLSVAESCTGGMLGSAVTSVPGSSAWFSGGVISYSDRVKEEVLGVPGSTILEHGAVSDQVVRAMCDGVAGLLRTEAAIAVSGIAGPEGGTPEKPVGTVWIAARAGKDSESAVQLFPGGRETVRRSAVAHSLGMLLRLLAAVSR